MAGEVLPRSTSSQQFSTAARLSAAPLAGSVDDSIPIVCAALVVTFDPSYSCEYSLQNLRFLFEINDQVLTLRHPWPSLFCLQVRFQVSLLHGTFSMSLAGLGFEH